MRGSLANIETETPYGLIQRHMPNGVIDVCPRVIARIAAAAAVQVAGVVGLVHRLPAEALVLPLTAENLYAGVDVHIHNGEVTLELYVVLAYGKPLALIAQQTEAAARAAVEHALGQDIAGVYVRVQVCGNKND